MDRVFEDTFYRSSTATADRASSFPIDLAETDQGFLLRATMPGVTPEQVQITIHGDTLTIRGAASSQDERDGHNWIIRERRGGNYHRMVGLPAPVNPDDAEARFKDGILELTLPKAAAARPRQIKVGTGGATTGTASTPADRVASSGSTAQASGPGLPESPTETEQPREDAEPTPETNTDKSAGGTASATPANPPSTHPDKDTVTESSEESMAASDPPSWTQERT
jgi:HSP20 family protein